LKLCKLQEMWFVLPLMESKNPHGRSSKKCQQNSKILLTRFYESAASSACHMEHLLSNRPETLLLRHSSQITCATETKLSSEKSVSDLIESSKNIALTRQRFDIG
jgi:hypothetical protein